MGLVAPLGDVKTVTPVLDTVQYADGDVLFVPIEIPDVFIGPNNVITLESITFTDADDQGVAFDLIFFSASKTLGTLNSAASISDANSLFIIAPAISIATTDYIDLGGCRLGGRANIGQKIKCVTPSLWMAGITRGGTPTYTASGLVFQIGYTQG